MCTRCGSRTSVMAGTIARGGKSLTPVKWTPQMPLITANAPLRPARGPRHRHARPRTTSPPHPAAALLAGLVARLSRPGRAKERARVHAECVSSMSPHGFTPASRGLFFFAGRARVTARVFGSCPDSSGGGRASSRRSAVRRYSWQSRNQARRAMPPGRSKRGGNCRTSAPCPFAGARRSLSPPHRSCTGKPTIHRQRTAPSSAGRKPRHS